MEKDCFWGKLLHQNITNFNPIQWYQTQDQPNTLRKVNKNNTTQTINQSHQWLKNKISNCNFTKKSVNFWNSRTKDLSKKYHFMSNNLMSKNKWLIIWRIWSVKENFKSINLSTINCQHLMKSNNYSKMYKQKMRL